MILPLAGKHFLSLDRQRSMRNEAETFLGNQFPGHPADPICLIFDTDKSLESW